MIEIMEKHRQECEEKAAKLGKLFSSLNLGHPLCLIRHLSGAEISRQRDEEWRKEVTRKFEQNECESQVFSLQSQKI
jgi:hypothetical protein